MTPAIIECHKKGYRILTQEQNAFAHLYGVYTHDALLSVVGNMFKKKGAKPYEYPDKPYGIEGSSDDEKGEAIMSEAEKKRRTEALFGRLRLMQANFELSKANSNTGDDE